MDVYMKNTYESPLASRYASGEMLYLFSPDKKFSTWRRLWIALARAEKELGLPVTDEQIQEMEAHVSDINYELAEQFESELRHDVMAHVHAYGAVCPKAKPIIHLGATSCYAGDNADIIIMREGLQLLRSTLVNVIERLAGFAESYRSLPTLGFTHFQPAQLTTVGKRASLWLYDFLTDLEELDRHIGSLKLLGSKGATGTQASFMELFGGDHEKVQRLEALISREMGFDAAVPVSGQTYSRKTDFYVLAALSGIAQSAGKFATDMRLLAHLGEIEEPFRKTQIGSSAMPYKRNPMRCERICSLSRLVIQNSTNAASTAYNQWFERTLDDSAGRRVTIPESFLAVDAILNICLDVVSGMVVREKVIERHIEDELPFMALENIMMRAVKSGGDRQELHERIRTHAIAAKTEISDGGEGGLVARIASDALFGLTENEIRAELEPSRFTGRAAEQVAEFLREHVRPALDRHGELIRRDGVELRV